MNTSDPSDTAAASLLRPGASSPRSARLAVVRTGLVAVAGAEVGLLLAAPSASDGSLRAAFAATAAMSLASIAALATARRLRPAQVALWLAAALCGMIGIALVGVGWAGAAGYLAAPLVALAGLAAVAIDVAAQDRASSARAPFSFARWWAVTTGAAIALAVVGIVLALDVRAPLSSGVVGVAMATLSLAQQVQWSRLRLGETRLPLSAAQPPRLLGTVAGVGGAVIADGRASALLWTLAILGWLIAGWAAQAMVARQAEVVRVNPRTL